ncbi:hypothetical protein SUGI_0307040 [Cryptomeria japonica]|nr:hypothetical protein SUGI_0307040 [Cryptomeria japonica]
MCSKRFKGLKENQRAAAVNSMVYEASARIKDPVHVCAGAVDQLHKKIAELESQLATTQEELHKKIAELESQLASEFIVGSHFSHPIHEDDDLLLEEGDESWKPLCDWKV